MIDAPRPCWSDRCTKTQWCQKKCKLLPGFYDAHSW